MSLFEKVLREHEKSVAEKAHALAAKLQQEADEKQAFLTQFETVAKTVAKPLFESFVSDAVNNGFPAEIEEGQDNNGQPFISLGFIAKRGAILGETPSAESAFVLRGNCAEKSVEHCSYFDQRPGQRGVKREKLSIESINQKVLEEQLQEFLAGSLKAWEVPCD